MRQSGNSSETVWISVISDHLVDRYASVVHEPSQPRPSELTAPPNAGDHSKTDQSGPYRGIYLDPGRAHRLGQRPPSPLGKTPDSVEPT